MVNLFLAQSLSCKVIWAGRAEEPPGGRMDGRTGHVYPGHPPDYAPLLPRGDRPSIKR